MVSAVDSSSGKNFWDEDNRGSHMFELCKKLTLRKEDNYNNSRITFKRKNIYQYSMKFTYLLLAAIFSLVIHAAEVDYFSPENKQCFLEYDPPFGDMLVPLGTTAEGYQYGHVSSIWARVEQDGTFTREVILPESKVNLYLSAENKKGGRDIIYLQVHYTGFDDDLDVEDKKIEDRKYIETVVKGVTHYVKHSDRNRYDIEDKYGEVHPETEKIFCYYPNEVDAMKGDAEAMGIEEDYERDKLRGCVELLKDYKNVTSKVKEDAKRALEVPEVKKLISDISAAYAQGGISYIPSVIALPKKKKSEVEAKPIIVAKPVAPVIKSPKKDKHGCIAYVDGDKIASIKSKGVTVLRWGPNYADISWSIKIKNISSQARTYWIKVKFYDAKGYMLDDDILETRTVVPGETITVSDTTMVDSYLWGRVKTKEFTVSSL